MEKFNKKPVIFLLLLVAVSIIVGGTIAYYTSSDTFNNEFNTGTYKIETQEAFVSPDNWTPGTTTPKTVIATNKGNTPAAVRVKLTPSWIGSDGVTTLPLTDGTNEAAIINYAFDKDYKWEKVGDWYYYTRPLDENESTSSLLESVTFNPNVNISASHNCVENETTHETICTTETTGYGDATYKLIVDIETCQYDKYKEIWSTNIDISNPETIIDGTLRKNDSVDYVFGENISRDLFESINILDVIKIPNNAIDSWDASVEQNESIMAWYTDNDNDELYELYIGQEGGVKANPDCTYYFSRFRKVNNYNLDHLDTSQVTKMYNMFNSSSQDVNSFELEITNWDVSNVSNFDGMFKWIGRGVETGRFVVKNFNISVQDANVSDIFRYVGNGANNLEFVLDNIYFGSSTGTNYMFEGTDSIGNNLKFTLNNIKFPKATSLNSIFWNVGSSTDNITMNITNIDAPLATTIEYGFQSDDGTGTTIINLDNWSTPSLSSMEKMFYNAHSGQQATYLTISNINFTNVTNMNSMFSLFSRSSRDVDIKITNFDTSNVQSMNDMFYSACYYANSCSVTPINVYANSIHSMLNSANISTTINIYSNPTNYTNAFYNAATVSGSGMTVNYTSDVTNIDDIIATKSDDSNVVKGSQLD